MPEQLEKDNLKEMRRWTWVAGLGSVVYVIAIGGFWYFVPFSFGDGAVKANEVGDFLAGVAAPLAFLWLLVGYFQQSREIRNQVAELKVLVETSHSQSAAMAQQIGFQEKEILFKEICQLTVDLGMEIEREFHKVGSSGNYDNIFTGGSADSIWNKFDAGDYLHPLQSLEGGLNRYLNRLGTLERRMQQRLASDSRAVEDSRVFLSQLVSFRDVLSSTSVAEKMQKLQANSERLNEQPRNSSDESASKLVGNIFIGIQELKSFVEERENG